MDAGCSPALHKLCWNEETCAALPEGCQDYVVLGGTFDHIHAGHKVLLSMSAVFARRLLMIGVSEGPLLAKKVLRELITTYEARRERLLNLLTSIRPGTCYDIVPIQDPFGPSIVDARLTCIVVSRETEAGGAAVNRRRAEAGLPALAVRVVDLVGPQDADEASKISSSGARRLLLGRFCGEGLPRWLAEGGQQGAAGWVRGSPPEWPYVVGLTGGIASGKSTISAMLQEWGAAVVRLPPQPPYPRHCLPRPRSPLPPLLTDGDCRSRGPQPACAASARVEPGRCLDGAAWRGRRTRGGAAGPGMGRAAVRARRADSRAGGRRAGMEGIRRAPGVCVFLW